MSTTGPFESIAEARAAAAERFARAAADVPTENLLLDLLAGIVAQIFGQISRVESEPAFAWMSSDAKLAFGGLMGHGEALRDVLSRSRELRAAETPSEPPDATPALVAARKMLRMAHADARAMKACWDAACHDISVLTEQLTARTLVPVATRVEQPTPTSCFRACVATVLDVPVEHVPTACDGDTWDWDAFQEWLAGFGLQAIELILDDRPILYPIPRQAPVIITGNSPRECVTGRHAVVGRCRGLMGFDYVHDPHPDGTFLTGEPTHLIFFTLLHPAAAIRLLKKRRYGDPDRRGKDEAGAGPD
jgi:hypothetical protein